MRILLLLTTRVTFLATLALTCLVHSTATAALFGSEWKSVTNITQQGELPAGLKTLEVDNRMGALRVTGTDTAPFDWSWSLVVRAPTDARGQQAAAKATCTAQQDGDRLRLVVSLPESDSKVSFQSNLEIRVPKSVAVITQNRYGKTSITDVTGDTVATGQNGAVELQRLTGKVRAETSYAVLIARDTGPVTLKNKNGRIEVSDVRGPLDAATTYANLIARDIAGDVKARNQNGSITLAKATGSADLKTSYASITANGVTGAATLQSQNGSITARNIAGALQATTSYAALDLEGAGPSFACRTRNGSIKLRATSSALTNLVARTAYGSMEIRLPADLKPALQAQTSYGTLKSDFPVLTKSKNPFADVPAGTPLVTLENQNGSIRVVRE